MTDQTYRLPTDDEWVSACLAGSEYGYVYCGSISLSGIAKWQGNSPQPVGELLPNAWGFYDMSGNVWEWNSSCGQGHDCSWRQNRGGSFGNTDPKGVTMNRVYSSAVSVRSSNLGFRLAQDP